MDQVIHPLHLHHKVMMEELVVMPLLFQAQEMEVEALVRQEHKVQLQHQIKVQAETEQLLLLQGPQLQELAEAEEQDKDKVVQEVILQVLQVVQEAEVMVKVVAYQPQQLQELRIQVVEAEELTYYKEVMLAQVL